MIWFGRKGGERAAITRLRFELVADSGARERIRERIRVRIQSILKRFARIDSYPIVSANRRSLHLQRMRRESTGYFAVAFDYRLCLYSSRYDSQMVYRVALNYLETLIRFELGNCG